MHNFRYLIALPCLDCLPLLGLDLVVEGVVVHLPHLRVVAVGRVHLSPS